MSTYPTFFNEMYAYVLYHRQIWRYYRHAWYARVRYRLGGNSHQVDILCSVSFAKSRNTWDFLSRAPELGYTRHTPKACVPAVVHCSMLYTFTPVPWTAATVPMVLRPGVGGCPGSAPSARLATRTDGEQQLSLR